MAVKSRKDTEREEAIARLRELIQPGDTVYTILRHVSTLGMYRVVSPVILVQREREGKTITEPRNLGWTVARALGSRYDERHEGVGVAGCGMDSGFELVYNLGRVLFPDGGPLEKSNGARRWQAIQENLNATIETDGGYLLRQEWL